MNQSAQRNDAISIPVAPLRRLIAFAAIVVVIVLVVIGVLSQRDRIQLVLGGTEAAYIDTTTYQSVVLSTNQVYFGKLRIDGDVYLLTDVYSLNASSETASGTVQLVKRGGELSGPTEPLVVPGRSVLFFENMRNDSQVMNAIRQIRAGNTTPLATPALTATPTPSASR